MDGLKYLNGRAIICASRVSQKYLSVDFYGLLQGMGLFRFGRI